MTRVEYFRVNIKIDDTIGRQTSYFKLKGLEKKSSETFDKHNLQMTLSKLNIKSILYNLLKTTLH